MLQLMAADRKKVQTKPTSAALHAGRRKTKAEVPRQSRSNSRRQSAQLYREYVGKSSIFGTGRDGVIQQKGRWQPDKYGGGAEGTPAIRMADSMPSPIQLEWQRQRRAKAMSASGASTTGGFGTGKGGIVQRHAEMRTYLQHCQRVLNARPRVDCSLPPKQRNQHSSNTTPTSSVFSSSSTTKREPAGNEEGSGRRTRRARAHSVPANGERIREENERLLARLLEIEMRAPPRYGSSRARHQSEVDAKMSNGI